MAETPKRRRAARTPKKLPPKPRRELTAAERNLEGLCFTKWAERLTGLDPAEYADRPLPSPSEALGRAERVAAYERRVSEGKAVFHPGDLVAPGRVADRENLAASMTE